MTVAKWHTLVQLPCHFLAKWHYSLPKNEDGYEKMAFTGVDALISQAMDFQYLVVPTGGVN